MHPTFFLHVTYELFLNQFFKFIISKASAFNNRFKSIRIYSFMPGDSYSMKAIRHTNMLPCFITLNPIFDRTLTTRSEERSVNSIYTFTSTS